MHTVVKFALAAAFLGTAPFGIHAAPDTAAPAASAQSDSQMSEGEIRKVDKDAKKITIKHGELKNLEMPPMTMVFQAKDPEMVNKVKQGDKVSFVAEKVGSQFMVTQIQVKQ
jgi:Cu(I)/Ag(I) efflux system periplasmic protein CusF